jgi:2,4-dienoyl-CoA reductase-like NADH-dependent reductase (Old Yellow Enzyme family)
MSHLFEPLVLRQLAIPNRVFVSPMCEYSCTDGLANDWHFVHLGSRAIGGAGLVMTEATAVTAEGRISPDDLGIWTDEHIEPLARIVRFIHAHGCQAGLQLAHAGRKGSTAAPWKGGLAVSVADGGWEPIGPTNVPFSTGYPVPRALRAEELPGVVGAFASAARRALAAGFDVVEVHAAHGYLAHQFLSPLSNDRVDEYGGSFDHRARLCLEIAEAVRRVWPETRPVFLRISATDWAPGGWDIEQSIELCRRLRDRGVDLIDCSSGGTVAKATIPIGPGYQTPFAARIRREAGIATGAVGLITTAAQADQIVRSGDADCVFLARELLRDPYWPLHAAHALGHTAAWPAQYLRAAPPGSTAR